MYLFVELANCNEQKTWSYQTLCLVYHLRHDILSAGKCEPSSNSQAADTHTHTLALEINVHAITITFFDIRLNDENDDCGDTIRVPESTGTSTSIFYRPDNFTCVQLDVRILQNIVQSFYLVGTVYL